MITPQISASGKAREWYFEAFGSSARATKSMTPLSSFSRTCSVSPLVMW